MVCRGRVIQDPTHRHDEIPGAQWLIGGIEDETREFFIELVPNRRTETIKRVFERNIRTGGVIITDGFASYPGAVNDHGSEHRVVVHNDEFVNEDGDHTNKIENLWYHLKRLYRSRNGISASNMIDFLEEFKFRHNHVYDRCSETFKNGYEKIIEMLKLE